MAITPGCANCGSQSGCGCFTDTALTGEQTIASWFPEITASFNEGLPSSVEESVKTGGVVTDYSGFQLGVTVPVGDSYTVKTRRTIHYTNGQETRGLATVAFISAPEAGATAILWLMSDDGSTGFGIGHHDGSYVFAWRFDNTTIYTPRSAWSDDTEQDLADGTTTPVDYTAPQIHRLRMLYLGYGPLIHEVRNLTLPDVNSWLTSNQIQFINDPSRTLPNLSNDDLGMRLEIVNSGTADVQVVTNSWGLGPVLGDVGLQQPDGDRVFPKADGVAVDVDGVAVETFTPLGAAGVYESGWVDTDGWGTIEVVVVTDQLSAGDGIEVEFTDDAQADTPTARYTTTRTFGVDEVSDGFFVFSVPISLDGFRVRFTNGGTPQGSFFLTATLFTDVTSPSGSITGAISNTSRSVMTRAALAAPNDAAVWDNITRFMGALRVSIAEQEQDVQIDALPAFDTKTTTVGTLGAQIDTGMDPGPAGGQRYSISIKSNATNNRTAYIGPTLASVTSGAPGAAYILDVGNEITLELDETQAVFAAGSTGSVQLSIASIGIT